MKQKILTSASAQSDFPFPKKRTVALYVIGILGKQSQKHLMQWLSKEQNRKVYFIVDSPYVLKELHPDLSNHFQVKVGYGLTAFVWDHVYEPWELIGGTSDDEKELADAILGVELTFALYRDFGRRELSNVLANLKGEREGKNGSALSGKFKGIPAIICGAGPSLEKSLEGLKDVGDRALIFGGGSALGPLSRGNIPIHFGVAVDPEPPLKRFLRQTYFEIPLFYQNQVSRSLLNCHHGPKLCIGESGSFPLEKWLVEQLELPSTDAGWNVATFATSVATLLGCNPIYFVGMDLCISADRSYAMGVEGEDNRENPISLMDRFGNEVTTRPDFLMAKKWLEAFAQKHKKTRFINASQEGLALEGIPDGTLKEIQKSGDLSSRIHRELLEMPSLKLEVLQEKFAGLERSLENVRRILVDYIVGLSQNKNGAFYDFSLEEEIFYQFYLLPNWEVWKYRLQNGAVIRSMDNPKLEKKLQELLFYEQLTKEFADERNV